MDEPRVLLQDFLDRFQSLCQLELQLPSLRPEDLKNMVSSLLLPKSAAFQVSGRIRMIPDPKSGISACVCTQGICSHLVFFPLDIPHVVVSLWKWVKRGLEWLISWEVPTWSLSQCPGCSVVPGRGDLGIPQTPLGALPGRSMRNGSPWITPVTGSLSTWSGDRKLGCPEREVWTETWEGERGSRGRREKQENPGTECGIATL